MSLHSSDNNQSGKSLDDFRFDNTSFEVFFKKYYQPLCFYCKFKYGFDLELAEDIVDSSFIKLWEARQTLASDLSPKSFLYKIIDNASLNILKHERVKKQYAQFVMQTTTEGSLHNSFDGIDLKQLMADIDSAIAALPEQMRKIFELSRFEGLKYAEIAAQLNISVKTVETQMSRALARLREKLARYIVVYVIVMACNFLINK